MKKKAIFVCKTFVLMMFVIFIIIFFKMDIFNMFRKGSSLDYSNDISYIEILSINMPGKDKGIVKIDDKGTVNNIFNYLNSLELVECNHPSNYFGTGGFTHIYVYGENEQLNVITISPRYLYLSKKAYNYNNKTYYIKKAGYNPITQNNNFYKYLNKIIDNFAF